MFLQINNVHKRSYNYKLKKNHYHLQREVQHDLLKMSCFVEGTKNIKCTIRQQPIISLSMNHKSADYFHNYCD